MSTGNLDVNTLAAALTIALKPLQELQEHQLAMMTLSTLYTPQEVQKLSKEYEALNENLRAILADIQDKTQRLNTGKLGNGNDVIDTRAYLNKEALTLREKAFNELAEFKRSNPHFMKAFNIGKVC